MPDTVRRHFPLPFPNLTAVRAYRAGIRRSEPAARIVGLERIGAWWAACLSTPGPLGLSRGLYVHEIPGRRCACSRALARRLRAR